MLRIFCILTLIFIVGCVTVEVPKYLNDKPAYSKNIEGNFNQTFTATVKSFKDMGWRVSETESTPIAKINNEEVERPAQTAIIITELKQRSMIIFSTYLMLNAYVRYLEENKTEVEIRYLSITSAPPLFRQWRVYKNDGLVEKLYKEINKNISKK